MANFSCLLVKMAMQLRVYDTFRLKVEQRSDGPESDNIAQTQDAQRSVCSHKSDNTCTETLNLIS